MNNPVFEILIIFLLLIGNGLFAMAEIAIVSARKARLSPLAEEGQKAAQTALDLARDPNEFLATTQIGITLVGILAGAFGGATLAQGLGAYFSTISWLAPYAETLAFGIVVVGVTYFSLIIGELVPKRIGLNNAERIAILVARPMRLLSKIVSPIVWFLGASTEFVLRILRIKPSTEPSVTEDEIKVLIEEGTQIGVFKEAEQDMIEGVLHLDERRVTLAMTPRHRIIWLDATAPPDELLAKITQSQRSRYPVADGDLDHMLGIVYARDLLVQQLTEEPFDIRALLHPVQFVPEGISILKLLSRFKEEQVHIALVTDEYGSIEGLVTPNDILEMIVGDIPSHEDEDYPDPQVVLREDGSWLIDGLLTIDKFKTLFEIEALPGETEGTYHTLGGFVIHQSEAIPIPGHHFDWNNFRFEIMDMDRRRVDKVLVTPPALDLEESDES